MRTDLQSHCFQRRVRIEWITALLAIAWIGPLGGSSFAAPQDTIDVFPLEKNRQWTYDFVWEKSDLWSGISESVSDSGRIEYLVVDSVRTTDSTVAWSVRQTEHLKHRHTYGTTFDSVYSIDRVSTFVLLESTVGLHALECDSRVWAFEEWPHGWDHAAAPVYRYWSDTTHTLFQSDESHWGQYLYFSASNGMYRRWRYMTSGSWHSDVLTADLVTTQVVDVAGSSPRLQPETVILLQNYPNPFNPSTTIRYGLPARSHITLTVFNSLGQHVATLRDGEVEAGVHETVFDAAGMPSGVYFLRLNAGAFSETKRTLLIR